MSTIANVVKNHLCIGCGTCVGICPFNAIEMYHSTKDAIYLPKISAEQCTRCGLCLKSCPGYAVDFEKLNLVVFGKQPQDSWLGNYLNCYHGSSNDPQIRYNSASGGLVTQFLIYALEKDLIDGAAVTRMRKENPLETEVFIARTKEDIISAAKTKYCPVAVNEILRQIRQETGRFAVVGLPCHLHGLRKVEEITPSLKKKIVFHIGLLCSHDVNFRGTEFILKRHGISKDQVRELSYRGEGWPGSMTIRTKENASIRIPLIRSWKGYWSFFSSFFFTPWRCLMCPDQAGELSDLSFGDAWLPEFRFDTKGESIIVTRTRLADSIIAEMASEKLVSISKLSPLKVKQSQAPNLEFKKIDFAERIELLKMFGQTAPILNLPLEGKAKFTETVKSYLSLLQCKGVRK